MLGSGIVLLGYSGHAYVVIEAAQQCGVNIVGYAERCEVSSNPYDLAFLGDDGSTTFDWDISEHYFVAVGDNFIRARLANKAIDLGKKLINILHPSSIVSTSAKLGFGIYLGPKAVVNALSSIADNVIINTAAIVEHECRIGKHVHIAPGAVLAGNVCVGDYSFVGANSVVKQGITIGNNVIIGAGAVVITDIEDNMVVAGSPAKPLR